MAFEYTPYRNPYIGTIADLMARGEDAKAKALIDVASAQARAAEAKGQIYGNAISSIGQGIAKSLTDYNDPKRKLQEMAFNQAATDARAEEATRNVLGQTERPMVRTAVPGTPFDAATINIVPPDQQAVGSRAFGSIGFGAPVQPRLPQSLFGTTEIGTQSVTPDSTFVESQGPERPKFNDPETGIFDLNSLQQEFLKLRDVDGKPFSPAVIAARLKPIQEINESILDYDAKKDSLNKSQQVAFGTMANGILKFVEDNGGSYTDAARMAVVPWEKRLGKEAVADFMRNFERLAPRQQVAQLEASRNQAASLLPNENLAKGAIKVDAFGREIARGPADTPPNPNRASFLRDSKNPNLTQEERDAALDLADQLKPPNAVQRNSTESYYVIGVGNVPLTKEIGAAGEPTRFFLENQDGSRTEKFAGIDFRDKPPASAANSSLSDTTDTAQQLVDGNLVPSMLSRRGNYNDILAEANSISKKQTGKPYNAARAQTEFSGAQRFMSSLNGPQQQRFQALAIAVVNTIDEVKVLSAELNNSGVPILNRIKLAAYAQTQGETKNGQLAARYIGAVNTLKEEFANLANGGYAPTESAWKLANEQINGNFGVKQMESSLTEVQRLINFRMQAFEKLTPYGVSPDNPVLGGKSVVGDRIYYDSKGNPIGKPQ